MNIPKNIFLVITDTIDGFNTSYAVKIPGCYDLYHALKGYKNMSGATVCTTWKGAQELAAFWNESYINNGSYIFAHTEAARAAAAKL